MFDTFTNDMRFAARTLRKSPGFSAIAIATLALGIGANTAIFSVVDGVILRPLSYPEAGRLFVIHEVVPKFSHIAPLIPVNAMHFREWRGKARSFDQMALIGGFTTNLTGTGEPERLPIARVSPGLFGMLGFKTQLGRTFTEEEDRPGRDRVVVLSHELWMRRFAADPGVVGRKILLDGNPYEVVGVLRPSHFPKLSQLYAMTISEERPQLWKPFALRDSEKEAMGDFNFVCIARLRRGVSPSQALSELNVLQANYIRDLPASELPEKIELRAALMPLQDQMTGRARAGLELLLAAVGMVLLVGCVNIANLLLARAVGRRREIAIRSAIGASAGRLICQALVESLFLSFMGGLLGVAVAYAAVRAILAYAPIDLPRMDEVHLDARVLLFTLAVSIVTGLLFGLLPAWRFSKSDPQEALQSGARGATAGRMSGRLRSLLVSVETGLSAMCLIAAGLLLHSFVKLVNVDRGFDVNRILTVDFTLPYNRYPSTEKRAVLLHSLVERVEALPGVRSAGVSNRLPLSGEGGNNLLNLEGQNLPLMERPLADIRDVSPDYFRTMGIPLRSGRIFAETDRNRKLALVSPLTAERLWPGQNAIGKRFRIGGDDSPLVEVVGVVGDIRGASLSKKPSLTVYTPYWQRGFSDMSLAVRTASDPAALSSAIRTAIRQIDSELPVQAFRTMQAIMTESIAQRRFQMDLVLLFAMAAMLLATLGIYGVVSYSVAQRTNEMGVRIALGAQPGAIARLVLRQGLVPVIAGLAAGVAASLTLGRFVGSLLFGVSAADPFTICAVIGLLTGVAAAASYVPAHRATHVDPVTALRYE
ncbi:MAG TPA: ABC transporter permease [Bryobacteraceae bacterium]|nr:ABC transporter permease [Bryobacteraceae bacterium]